MSGLRQLLSVWKGSLLTSGALAKSANVNPEGGSQGVLSESRVSSRGSQKSCSEHPASPGSPGPMSDPRERTAFAHGEESQTDKGMLGWCPAGCQGVVGPRHCNARSWQHG